MPLISYLIVAARNIPNEEIPDRMGYAGQFIIPVINLL